MYFEVISFFMQSLPITKGFFDTDFNGGQMAEIFTGCRFWQFKINSQSMILTS